MKNITIILLVFFSLISNANANVQIHSHSNKEQNHTHYSCSMHPEIIGEKGDSCTICGMFLTEPVENINHQEHIEDQNDLGNNDNNYSCPMHPEITGKKGDSCTICGMFLTESVNIKKHNTIEQQKHNHIEQKEHLEGALQSDSKIFVCPMHPQIRDTKRSNCPICGMFLEEKTIKKDIEIHVSGNMQQALSIRTYKVKPISISKKISTFGKVYRDERSVYKVYPRIEGWLKKSEVFNVGEYVEKGDVLFYVYSPELLQAQEEYLITLNSKDYTMIDSSKKRLILLGFNDYDIKELTISKKAKVNIPILSDFTGYVTDLNIKTGSYISKTKELVEISNFDNLWVIANIFPKDKKWISKDSYATIFNENIDSVSKKISYIYPELDKNTNTIKVQIDVPYNSGLRPNDFVNVNFKSKTFDNEIFIPSESLILTGRENRVVVKNGENSFKSVSVEVGLYADNMISIISGINYGDEVVTSGQFLIDSEASIQGSLNRIGDRDD